MQTQWSLWAVWLMTGLAWLLLLLHDGRWLIAGLAALEAALVAMLLQVWPLPLAATQLIAGWLAGALLAVAHNLTAARHEEPIPHLSERLLRMLAGGIALALVFTVAPTLATWWPQVPTALRLGGVATGLLGLLQVMWSSHPLRLSVGLLVTLAGFLTLYAWQQTGLLVIGLLAIFQMLVAWVGSYVGPTAPSGEATP